MCFTVIAVGASLRLFTFHPIGTHQSSATAAAGPVAAVGEAPDEPARVDACPTDFSADAGARRCCGWSSTQPRPGEKAGTSLSALMPF
jgi:hypothetical protein